MKSNNSNPETAQEKFARQTATYRAQEILLMRRRLDSSLPQVVPSGVYDTATAESVRLFQKDSGIPVTGKIDLETWNALQAARPGYEELLSEALPILPFRPPLADGGILPGETSDLVYILQVMLARISLSHPSLEGIAIDGNYGEETAEGVKEFQRVSGLGQTGKVDKITWNRLADAYNAPVTAE